MNCKEITINRWEELQKGFNNYSFFQTPAWVRAICKTYSLKTKIFEFDIEGQKIVLPFYFEAEGLQKVFGPYELKSLFDGTYGGIICKDSPSEGSVKKILDYLKKRKNIKSFMIYPNPLSGIKWPEEYKQTRYMTNVIKLDNNFEFLWENVFSGKVRNQTRKAQKSALALKSGNDIDFINAFFELYKLSCERWGIEAYYPPKLFKNLSAEGKEKVKILTAEYEGKTIAGILLLCGYNDIFYWAGAFDKEYSQYCPNNFLLTEAVKDGCEKGYKYFNMGASDELQNVKKYKESFGCEEIEYYSIGYINRGVIS